MHAKPCTGVLSDRNNVYGLRIRIWLNPAPNFLWVTFRSISRNLFKLNKLVKTRIFKAHSVLWIRLRVRQCPAFFQENTLMSRDACMQNTIQVSYQTEIMSTGRRSGYGSIRRFFSDSVLWKGQIQIWGKHSDPKFIWLTFLSIPRNLFKWK